MTTQPIVQVDSTSLPSARDTPILTDEPRFSSAALCVRLQHLDQTFRPEFTHQCTPNESWRGCRPSQRVLSEATHSFHVSAVADQSSTAPLLVESDEKNEWNPSSNVNTDDNYENAVLTGHITAEVQEVESTSSESLLHKSHEGHAMVTNELDIQVVLSPSCRLCHVKIHRSPIRRQPNSNRSLSSQGSETTATTPFSEKRNSAGGKENTERDAKKVKTDPSLENISTPSNVSARNNLKGNTTAATVTPIAAVDGISDADILQSLAKALPDISSDLAGTVENDFLPEPFGEVLDEYSVATSSKSDDEDEDNHYVLTIADGRSSPDVTRYHNSVQRLALLYIENADDVDISDNENGFWKVMYVFRRQKDDEDGTAVPSTSYRYSLVGYFTLFHFIALFHKPQPGLIVRICQALILPSYQGQGHGQRLLRAVFDLAHGGDKYDKAAIYGENSVTTATQIVQVNVEDPAPGFVALRNKMDFEMVKERGKDWNWPGGVVVDGEHAVEEDSFFSTLTEHQVLELSTKAKITPRQVHIVNELLKLSAVLEYCRNQNGSTSTDHSMRREEIETKFRLLVKRRLNKELHEEIGALSTKEEKKAFLADAFDAELKRLRRLASYHEKQNK
jgi:histone acetyltransferase 1